MPIGILGIFFFYRNVIKIKISETIRGIFCFMSDLKARSLLLKNTLGTAYSPASSKYVIVSSLSRKIVMGPRFKVSSERLEKPGSFTTTPGRFWGMLILEDYVSEVEQCQILNGIKYSQTCGK